MIKRKAGATRRPAKAEPKASSRKAAASVKPQNSRLSGVSIGARLYAWFDNHRSSCAETLLRLLTQWTNSLLTWLVIGIAMALPVGLYVVLSNVEQLADRWDGNAKISVYFKDGVTKTDSLRLQNSLQQHRLIIDTHYLSSEQALAEFELTSGFGNILQSLPSNPLPSLLELSLNAQVSGVDEIDQLAATIRQEPIVDSVQLDLHWVQRLQAILVFARQFVGVLAALLAVAVLLVTGNTIRLAIESRKDEIVVIKLVGGTDAFVRRPLLYTGFWYGLGGALVASLIIQLSTQLLSGSVGYLFGLYDAHIEVRNVSIEQIGLICVCGASLGLLGAWLSVAQHLHKIQPK